MLIVKFLKTRTGAQQPSLTKAGGSPPAPTVAASMRR